MSSMDEEVYSANRHSIQLTNVKSGEIFIHSLCLLRGKITTAGDCCIGGKVLLVHQSTESQKDVKSTEWDVAEWGEFKCLTSLNPGPNHFTLSWECTFCDNDTQLAFQIYLEERITNYKVLPVWITCQNDSDEENKLEENLNRVGLMAQLAQCVTSECLHDKGFGRSSIFCLEPNVAVFQSKLTSADALSMNHEALWQHIARELMNSELASHHIKYLAFLSCTHYEPSPPPPVGSKGKKRMGRVKGNIALGAGGLALLGSASIHTWPCTIPEVLPCFLDTTPVDTKKYFDDSCRRGTNGGCFATALGSVCHELGHTFDLGHTQNGIMGRGFHHTQKIFTLPSCIEDATVQKNCSEKLILSKTSPAAKTQNANTPMIPLRRDINISWSQPRQEFYTSAKLKKIKEKHKTLGTAGCKKYIKNDEFSFWSNGCAAILAFHRWFNDNADHNNPPENITYNRQMRCISSRAGLRVVQIRNDADGGAVLSSWQFLSPQGRSQFLIPSSCSLAGENPQVDLSVIAEDSMGNVLKDKL